MSTINSLNYDITFIDTISSLAGISPLTTKSVIISKDSETNKLFITSNTNDQSVYYTVAADASKFDFKGSKFAILSFDQFTKYFSSCCVPSKDGAGSPVLETENDDGDEPVTVIIKQPLINAKVTHTLAAVDCLIKPALYNPDDDTYASIDVINESAKFNLTNEQLSYLQKMIGVVGATNVKFSVDNAICTVTLFNPKTSDVFSQSYAVTIDNDPSKFELSIPASNFAMLPRSDYNLTIDREGMLHFAQTRNDGIDVNLYLLTIE